MSAAHPNGEPGREYTSRSALALHDDIGAASVPSTTDSAGLRSALIWASARRCSQSWSLVIRVARTPSRAGFPEREPHSGGLSRLARILAPAALHPRQNP